MKIAFIGGGNMAKAIIKGLLKQNIDPNNLLVIDTNETARQAIRNQNIQCQAEISDQLKQYDVIFLAIKPDKIQLISRAITPFISQSLIISIAAGIHLSDITRWLGGHTRVIRAMPNTPATITRGMTALIANPQVNETDRSEVTQLMETIGQVIWCIDDQQIDKVTAISGSGPAYVLYFIEALQAAAIHLGLPNDMAQQLTLATFSGAIQLANNSSETPATLRRNVTSPNGTTDAAIQVFIQEKLQKIIEKGAQAAFTRACEMSNEFGEDSA